MFLSFLQPVRKTIWLITIISITFTCKNINQNRNIKNSKNGEIEGIHAAFYNSKGNRISLSTTQGRIILADSMLNVLKVVPSHSGRANSSFFSLNDSFIISGGQDGLLNVNDANTLQLVNSYDFDFNSWTSVHGYSTLGGCGEEGKLVLYNKQTDDTLLHILENDGAFHLYYIQPDTSLVVSSGISGYEFNILKNKIVHKYTGHSNWVYCIMPSNDKTRIVTASKDSTVKIFQRTTEKNMFTSSKLDGAVYVTCFSNDDNTVAASTSVGTIYFLDTTLSKIKMRIKAFNTHINTIHYSPDGTKIVAGTEGGGAKVFSTVTGKLMYKLDYSQLE